MALNCNLTDCVSDGGVGVGFAWEQKKLEGRKMLENMAESPPSTVRFVSQRLMMGVYRRINKNRNQSSGLVAKATSTVNN